MGFWDAYCTAGALLDFDRRTLLVFTDMLDYGGRMAFLDSLTRTWPGWQVGWAYGWLTDFASYPGVLAPVAPQVLNSVEPVDALAALDERDRAVVTVRASGGEGRTYEMNVLAGPEPWWIGTRLLELLREDQRCIRPTRMPVMGMHVDVDDAAAGVWTTRWWPGLKDSWSQLWPGWSLEFWDRSEEHVARTGGALELPSIDPDAELDRYARRLDGLWLPILRERRKSPVDPTYPADFVDLSERDYQRQRRVATDRPS